MGKVLNLKQGLVDCPALRALKRYKAMVFAFREKEIREKLNSVWRHCWVSLRSDVCWRNSELLAVAVSSLAWMGGSEQLIGVCYGQAALKVPAPPAVQDCPNWLHSEDLIPSHMELHFQHKGQHMGLPNAAELVHRWCLLSWCHPHGAVRTV